MNRFSGIAILMASVLFCACTGDSMKEYELESIYLDKTDIVMQPGDNERVTARAVPSVAVQPVFSWSSSDISVASVSNGIITAVGEGKAEIKVSSGKSVSVVKVSVVDPVPEGGVVLLNLKLNELADTEFLETGGAGTLTAEGLTLSQKGKIVRLNKFYALGERMVRYRIEPSSTSKLSFRSSEGDFNAFVDVPGQEVSIATSPVTSVAVPFLKGDREYDVEIYHIYNKAVVKVIEPETGKSAEVSAVMDGAGGVGSGALHDGFYVGMQWDYYCFGLESGDPAKVKRISVFSLKDSVRLLIYGDSISQPEGYYPLEEFGNAWTQKIISRLGGNAMSSGRGGGTIDMVMEYIKNELPYIKTEYVMVTIGANGGNTREKLTALVGYIRSQGAVPVINNIPCNESGTQVADNALIESVRREQEIKGCMFDLATSLAGDGKEVDKSLMFFEDYSGSYGWQIWHHPNSSGSAAMFDRTFEDVPEIYE